MSKEDIFQELVSLRILASSIIIEKNYSLPILHDRLQELIWKVGEDIGEF